MSRYLEAVAKWEKIMAKIGDDQAAFTKALQVEIYAKIDPEKLYDLRPALAA